MSYERSLSLRPSSLVREHLDAVLEEHPVRGELEEFGSMEELRDDPDWGVYEVFPGSGERPEVASISYFRDEDGNNQIQMIAIRERAGYRTWVRSEGMTSGPSSSSNWQLDGSRLLAPGWLAVDEHYSFSYYGERAVEGPDGQSCTVVVVPESVTHGVLLCRLGEPLRCASLTVSMGDHTGCQIFCDGEQEEVSDPALIAQHCAAEPEGWTAELEVDRRGQVRLALTEGDPPDDLPLEPGRWYALDEALETLDTVQP